MGFARLCTTQIVCCFSIKGLSPSGPLLLKVVCHPLCQLNLLICTSHESMHNLLTWCPVLKNSKLFHQVTCTCFLSQFIWFQSTVFKNIKLKLKLKYFYLLFIYQSCDI